MEWLVAVAGWPLPLVEWLVAVAGRLLPLVEWLVTAAGRPILETVATPFPEPRTFRPLGRLLTHHFRGGRSVSPLQMMQQRGCNVGGAEAFFEQTFDQLILPFEFARLKRGADLVEHCICARLFHFIHRGGFGAVNPRVDIAFDVADLEHFAARSE